VDLRPPITVTRRPLRLLLSTGLVLVLFGAPLAALVFASRRAAVPAVATVHSAPRPASANGPAGATAATPTAAAAGVR
jgi:hypothetical protein